MRVCIYTHIYQAHKHTPIIGLVILCQTLRKSLLSCRIHKYSLTFLEHISKTGRECAASWNLDASSAKK